MILAQQIALLLVGTLFSLYIGVVMVRLLLALVRANFYNPLSQAIVSITNPILVPMRRVIPSFGALDTASIVLMLALQFIELWLETAITGRMPGYLVLITLTPLLLIRMLIYIYIFALIAQAVISWVAPGVHNPMISLLHSLTEPLLRPIRKVVPPIGMLDLTPMVVILLLYIALMTLNYVV